MMSKKTHEKLFLAADGRRQKLDNILYRLPTWHPIYSMPFGQNENLTYLPFRAEYLPDGNVAGWQNNHLSAFVERKRAAKNYRCFDIKRLLRS